MLKASRKWCVFRPALNTDNEFAFLAALDKAFHDSVLYGHDFAVHFWFSLELLVSQLSPIVVCLYLFSFLYCAL